METALQTTVGPLQEQVQRDLDGPELPDTLGLLLATYYQLRLWVTSGGFGPAVLDGLVIEAWERKAGYALTLWETETLLIADKVGMTTLTAKTPPSSPELPDHDLTDE